MTFSIFYFSLCLCQIFLYGLSVDIDFLAVLNVLMLSIKCHVVNSQFETMINWLKLIVMD
jgi:hypothetical protein